MTAATNRGSALSYNPAYGAFIYNPTGAGACAVDVRVDRCNFFGMQLLDTVRWPVIKWTGATCLTSTVDSCIVMGASETHNSPVLDAGHGAMGESFVLTMQNTLAIGTSDHDTMLMSLPVHANVIMRYCTTTMPASSRGEGATIYVGRASVINNTASIGFGLGPVGPNVGFNFGTDKPGSTGTHNASSLATLTYKPFAADAVVNALPSQCFINTGPVPRSWDFRLPSSSPLRGAGTHGDDGITTDILARTRNTPDDIGCWAFATETFRR